MKARYVALSMILAGVLGAQGRGFGGGSFTPPTPAQMIQREVNMLTKYFTLTTSQVSEVTSIVTTEQTCLEGNSTNMQTARAGLVTAVKSGSATNVSAAVNALTSIQGAEQTCRATAAAGIYADLDSTQQAKVGKGLGPLLGGGGFGPRGR
jgi:hypothetical protein